MHDGSETPFRLFLEALRASGLPVDTRSWLTFLRALSGGMIATPTALDAVGRAILCRSEEDFDAWEKAFSLVFSDLPWLDEALRARLQEWLAAAAERPAVEPVAHALSSPEALWRELFERLKAQDAAHHGGSHWVGTGGTSPFGYAGRGAAGIRIGGPGGGRQAVTTTEAPSWEAYRPDRSLEARDAVVALRAVRRLAREGAWRVDLDETVQATCREGGEIALVERRARENQVHLMLLLDAGGSMRAHAERVVALFTAAEAARGFRSVDVLQFHNVPDAWMFGGADGRERVSTSSVLARLTPQHRMILVGDACMAPYELFSATGWPPTPDAVTGLGWLQQLRSRAPASVWLNPEPEAVWDHPTIAAIRGVFPMFELTLAGLRQAVRQLRMPI
jgi:hypothetical protein